MPLSQLPAPFDHPNWLFEVKYDGFRARGTSAWSRARGTWTDPFRRYASRSPCALALSDAALDGEIIYVGPDGKPQFSDLMRRRGPQRFYAFDLLWLNGRDHRGLPLLERKRRSREIRAARAIVAAVCGPRGRRRRGFVRGRLPE